MSKAEKHPITDVKVPKPQAEKLVEQLRARGVASETHGSGIVWFWDIPEGHAVVADFKRRLITS